MPVSNIQDWADITSGTTIPAMQQAIQDLEQYVLINTPLVEGAQDTADNALTNADLALTKIYDVKIEGIVYTDDRIQQLRSLLEAKITEVQEYVQGPQLEALVISYIQAYTTYVDSALASFRNDLESTKIELGDRITIVEDILDELLNTTIPTCCGNIAEINDKIQQITNDMEALTLGLPGGSIAEAINEVKEANAYTLGLSILRTPNTDWIIDSPSGIYAPKTPVPSGWFGLSNVYQPYYWYAEFGGNTTQTIGQAIPINVQSDKVYKVTAIFKVSDQGSFPETYYALGMSTWIDENTPGALNSEKTFRTESVDEFVEQYSYFTTDVSLVPAGEYNYSDYANNEGLGEKKEVVSISAGSGSRKAFVHFRQNTIPTYYTINGGPQPPKVTSRGSPSNSSDLSLVSVTGDIEYLSHWLACSAKVERVSDLEEFIDLIFKDSEGLGQWKFYWGRTTATTNLNSTLYVDPFTFGMRANTTFTLTNTARPGKAIQITFPAGWKFPVGDTYSFASYYVKQSLSGGTTATGSTANFATFTGLTDGGDYLSNSRVKLYKLKVEDVTEFFKQRKEVDEKFEAVNADLANQAAEIDLLEVGLQSSNAEIAELQYDVNNIKEAAFIKTLFNVKTLSQKMLNLGDNHLINETGRDNEFRSTTTVPIITISGNNLSWPEEFDTLKIGLNILTPNLRGKVNVWLRIATGGTSTDVGLNVVSADDDQSVNSINLNWVISREDYLGITGLSIMINLGTENYVLADNTYLGDFEYLGGLNYPVYTV